MAKQDILNYVELCALVEKRTNLPRETVRSVMDTAFESITDSLQKHRPVRVLNFGVFSPRRSSRDRPVFPGADNGTDLSLEPNWTVKFKSVFKI